MTLQFNNLKSTEVPKPNNFVEATIQLAHCYKSALNCGCVGDDEGVRIWVDASRSIKAFFKKYQEDDSREDLISKLEKNGSKQILAEALVVLKSAEPFILQWANRFQELSFKTYKDFDDVHWEIFLDFIIPLTWDWDSDLFVVQHKDSGIIQRLIARGQKRIIIIEDDLKQAKKIEKLLKVDLSIEEDIVIVNDKDKISRAISVWVNNPPFLSRVITDEIFHDDDSKRENLKEIEEIVKEGMVNAITFDNTIKAFDQTWVKNGLGNFSDLIKYPHFSVLKQKFKEFPVIIVSPGPSLEKNVHLLRELKGRAMIIAASHSLGYLKEQDVIPDIVLHVDPNVGIERYFSEFEIDKVELLILSATADPALFNLPARHKTWIYANAYFDNWLMELLNLEDYTLYGSSVSVCALKMAYKWGCSKIALIGQDLSFDSGKYYAGNTYAPEKLLNVFSESEASQMYKLPGYYGGEVITKNDYRVYHGQFMQLAKEVNEKTDIKLFNCTEGGAYIKGFEHVKLSDFIDQEIDKHLQKQYNLSAVDMKKILSDTRDMRPIRGNLVKIKRHLNEVEKLINAALIKSKQQHDNSSGGSIENLQKKVAKKMKKSMVVKMALQDSLSKLTYSEDYENTEQGYREKGVEMYKACLEVIKNLKQEVNKIKI